MKNKMLTLSPEIGNRVKFYVQVPLQNVGITGEARTGEVVKVNEATFIVIDEGGREYCIGRKWSSNATYLPKIM